MVEHDGMGVDWLGYATVRLAADGTVVYLDPGRYGVLEGRASGADGSSRASPARSDRDAWLLADGDVVCVTHDHHYDPDAIRAVAGADATLVCFEGVDTHRIDRDVERPVDLPFSVREVDTESDLAVGAAVIRTTAAYNEPGGPHTREDGEPYHPEGLGCGFLVTLDGTTVYWPGDTDVLEGTAHLDVDVFCPPIGGGATMDRHEAADLAEAMVPDLVVPVHYDTHADIGADAAAFAADLESRGISVDVQDPSQ